MFRKKQNLVGSGGCPVVLPSIKTLPSGECEVAFEDQAKKLPPVENYDLTTQLRAGIDLEEVPTKILGGAKFEYKEKEVETNEE